MGAQEHWYGGGGTDFVHIVNVLCHVPGSIHGTPHEPVREPVKFSMSRAISWGTVCRQTFMEQTESLNEAGCSSGLATCTVGMSSRASGRYGMGTIVPLVLPRYRRVHTAKKDTMPKRGHAVSRVFSGFVANPAPKLLGEKTKMV